MIDKAERERMREELDDVEDMRRDGSRVRGCAYAALDALDEAAERIDEAHELIDALDANRNDAINAMQLAPQAVGLVTGDLVPDIRRLVAFAHQAVSGTDEAAETVQAVAAWEEKLPVGWYFWWSPTVEAGWHGCNHTIPVTVGPCPTLAAAIQAALKEVEG